MFKYQSIQATCSPEIPNYAYAGTCIVRNIFIVKSTRNVTF